MREFIITFTASGLHRQERLCGKVELGRICEEVLEEVSAYILQNPGSMLTLFDSKLATL